MKLAIFDLDGTILRGNSWPLFYRRSWVLNPRVAPRLAWATVMRLAGRLDGRGLRESALGALRGRGVREVAEVGERLWGDELQSWVRPAARREIEARRAAGYAVGLATGAFDFVAAAAARELGLEVWASTRLEYRDGSCTGRIAGDEARGEAKAAAVRAALAGRLVDWAGSSAFSDDWEDLPLWGLVGEAVWVRAAGAGRGRNERGLVVTEVDWGGA